MNARTWQALARRQQSYRRVLLVRMAKWTEQRIPCYTDPAALCALAALADRADRHDARMQRHMNKALAVSDLFAGRQPS